MTEAQYLEKACSLLHKSNSNELKDTVILTDEFLEPFQFFRDEWMWHPRKTSGGRGPGLSTTASIVSSEYRNGFKSKHTSIRGHDIQTSGWKESDFYIFTILRVLQGFQLSDKPLHVGRSTAYNVEQAAKGVHLALSAVISWYNPSRQSAMAQLIEGRLPPSRHTAQSSKLKSKSNITSSGSDIICFIWAGRVTIGRNGVFSHIDFGNAPQPAADQGGDPAARLSLEGEAEDVGLDENEEVQTTISTPSISRSTTPSDGPASKRPRTRAYLLKKIDAEKAGFYTLLQDFDDSDTVGEVAQLEVNNRHSTLRRLWEEYRDHWGVHDAPELLEFPTKFTLQMKF